MIPVSPIDDIIHCTVRIECLMANGQTSYGTGSFFIFNAIKNKGNICIITNRHVMEGAIQAGFNLTLARKDGGPDLGNYQKITIESPQTFCIYHPDISVDLVAIPVNAIFFKAKRESNEFYIRAIGKGLTADAQLLNSLPTMSEIAMVGYPIGLWDQKHNLPLIRRGVTSTHPKRNLNNRPEFMIDAACFPGSSGSPVFLANLNGFTNNSGVFTVGSRFLFLGCLWGGPMFDTEGEIITVPVPTNTDLRGFNLRLPTNLGYVVNHTKVWELENLVGMQLEAAITRNSSCPCGSGKRYKSCCGQVE